MRFRSRELSPGPSVALAAGAPVAENGVFGALGGVKLATVSGWPPALLKVTVPVRCPPTAVPPRDRNAGLAWSNPAAACPVPDKENDSLPPPVSAVSCPATRPIWLGLNVTGTEIFCPVVRVAGSDFDGVPT